MVFERHRAVIELKRRLRKTVDVPYGELFACSACGHAFMVERGYGDGFTPHEGETAYDGLVRFFGREHREVALADGYRNAKVDLMSNATRWHLILNGFAHASYSRFVPPDGRFAAVPVVPELLRVLLMMGLASVGWLILSVAVTAIPLGTFEDPVLYGLGIGWMVHMVVYPAWVISVGLRSWSPQAHARKRSGVITRTLAPMLVGLDADAATLNDAVKEAKEQGWVSASVDPVRVLELVAERSGQRAGRGAAPMPDRASEGAAREQAPREPEA